MSKRIRLLTSKNKSKINNEKESDDMKDKEVFTARGRLKGALMEVLGDESDGSSGPSPVKRERRTSQERERDCTSEEEDKPDRNLSSARQSYVLKLFDRSVDLSQFSEDSPLYPICRAWIKNQPKANYSTFGHVGFFTRFLPPRNKSGNHMSSTLKSQLAILLVSAVIQPSLEYLAFELLLQ